jgi:pSer/pThr/pTyr-binding forkhead associated (FHA) protein
MPTLVVRYPDGSETEHEIFGDLRIGRQDGNDLILTEGGVSRQHARIFLEEGKVLLEDLSSANGTYVDGERIGDVVALTSQSQVVLGDYELRIKGGAAPRASGGQRRPARTSGPAPAENGPKSTKAMPTLKPARPPGAGLAKSERPGRNSGSSGGSGGAINADVDPPPRVSMAGPTTPVLRGLTGPWANMIYPIKTKVLVGRTPPAVVLLEDDSISRKHAELEKNARGAVMLRDLGSANGTLLNGERLGQEPVQLSPGDVIQFGMVEVVYESGEQAGSALGRRGSGGRAKAADPSDAPPPKSRKLIGVAAALAGIVLVAGVAKVLVAPPAQPVAPVDPGPTTVVVDPTEQVQTLLSECRSYSSKDMGSEPQWEKAEAKCEEARVLDPINAEVNTELKRIRVEKEAAEYFAQGLKLLSRLKEEDAIDVLQKIPKESNYYWRRAKIKMDEALAQVNKRAEDDCKRYLRDAQWAAAVPRCDRYMSTWCQSQTKEDLEPPLGFSLSLEGRIGKKEWRPKDKLFVQFLIARRKVDPKAEAWTCKAGYGGNIENEDEPSAKVRKMFKGRYPNPYMNSAMFDYWGGRGNESVAKLQKVRSNYELAPLHNQTDLLIKDVGNVDNLYKSGSTLLTTGEIEKAAEPFEEALEVDKRLMGELWESVPSFYRKNIQQDMAEKAYERGRDWAKRDDPRRACRLWKIGFRFYKGNTDLIRVLSNLCSTQATKLFASASSCGDLTEVMEWAVAGDGLEEKVAKKREELQCK